MCELVVVVYQRARIAGSSKKNPKDLRQTTKSIVRYSFIYKIMVIANGKRSFDLPPWQSFLKCIPASRKDAQCCCY